MSMTRWSQWAAASAVAALAASVAIAEGPSAEARSAGYLDEIWRATGTPGISVAVAVDGRLAFAEGIGFADLENLVEATPSTVYNLGSISKGITAVAVVQLVENGKVGLDDPVQLYVPSFPEKRAPVTVRHLLTHTSGIRHYRDDDFPSDPEFNNNYRRYHSLEEAIGIFEDDPLLFEPGAFHLYTSYGVNLLQGVVESASGLTFEEYLAERVFRPAGMLSTSLDLPERIVPHRARGYLVEDGRVTKHPDEDVTYKFAGGGMIGTVEDLVRLAAALNHGELLGEEGLELMWRPHVDPVMIFRGDEPPRHEERWKQGLLWRVREDDSGRRYAYVSGTVKGFNAVLLNYLDDGVVVAIAGNGHPVTPALRAGWRFAEFFLPAAAADGN